jgi:hypothetical protein
LHYLPNILKSYSKLYVTGAVRSDTVLYDLCAESTTKLGCLRKRGIKLNYVDFDYYKNGKDYITTKKVLTNLFNNPIFNI